MNISASSSTNRTRLTHPHHMLAWRTAWWLILVVYLAVYCVAFVQWVELRSVPCTADCTWLQVSASDYAPFAALGIPYAVRAYGLVVAEVLMLAVFLSVAGLIYWQRSDDWQALLGSIALITLGLTTTGTTLTLSLFGGWPRLVVVALQTLTIFLNIGAALTLPSGRLTPRWSGVLLPVYLLVILPYILLDGWAYLQDPYGVTFNLISTLAILVAMAVQLYRYHTVYSALERQQAKWVLLGGILTILSFLVGMSVSLFGARVLPPLVSYFIDLLTSRVLILAFPIALLFSILRARLWEVDITLNRTLVYGVVATVLVLLMIVEYVVFNIAYRAMFGVENATIALVLGAVSSTLLYNPLRKRLQALIDRRLFGLEYDLNQIAAAQKKVLIDTKSGPLTGHQIGGYSVGALLGRGGMGEVYQAERAGQTVAIKVLLAHGAQDPQAIKRFEHEARAMQTLQHPNIVKLVSAGAYGGDTQAGQDEQPVEVRYLALEFVQGQDLGQTLKQQGRMPLAQVRAILSQAAAALDYAHTQGIVHRDIKPSNLMLNMQQQVKVMDFGIAKLQSAVTSMTGSGMIGTIDYMAPEQITAAKEVTAAVDIYALGVLAYELLTGQPPFPRGNAGQTVFAHIQQPPPDARELVPDLPQGTAQALQCALAKDPAQRYKTAAAFVAALDGAAVAESIARPATATAPA
jgi:predicted Ser/Thr protein kinase